MDMAKIKTNIKKFFSNPNTLTFLLILGLIIVIYVIYSYMITAAIKPSTLPYATQTIKEKSEIKNDMLGKVDISGTFISNDGDNLVQNRSRILGKYVNRGYTIIKNSFFYNEALTNETISEETYLSNIPDGYTIYKLPVNYHSTYGNSIMSGNYIDLYLQAGIKFVSGDGTKVETEQELVYAKFIKSIQVLGVVDEDGLDVFLNTDEGERPAPKNLYFSVPNEIFELMSRAKMLGCDFVPVPRNAGYSENPEDTEIVNDTLRAMIDNQSRNTNN